MSKLSNIEDFTSAVSGQLDEDSTGRPLLHSKLEDMKEKYEGLMFQLEEIQNKVSQRKYKPLLRLLLW